MKIKVYLFASLFLFVLASCAWENEDPSSIYDLFYLERNGAQMPVHVHGNSESNVFIIILHGGPGGTGLQYRPGVFSNDIESKYAVAYFDQRGQGMSQGHLDQENTNVHEMVEDVKALAQAMKYKYGSDTSLFLLGHSWGGTLGTAYLTTQDYQTEFKGWIEVDGAHDFDLMVDAQKRLIPEVGNAEILLGRDTAFWEEYIEISENINSQNYTYEDVVDLNGRAFEAEAKLTLAGVINSLDLSDLNVGQRIKNGALINNPSTTWLTGRLTNSSLTQTDGIFTTAFQIDLEKIEIPTLLLWGKFDFVVPAELGEQALEEISSEHKRLVIFEKSGHSPMDNEGDLFGKELIDFIEEFR